MKTILYLLIAILTITSVAAISVDTFTGLTRQQLINNMAPSYSHAEAVNEGVAFYYSYNSVELNVDTQQIDIIPAFARGFISYEHIGACLESYTLETCKNVLVNKNGSTEGTYRGETITIRSAKQQAQDEMRTSLLWMIELQDRLAYKPSLEELNSILSQPADAPTIT